MFTFSFHFSLFNNLSFFPEKPKLAQFIPGIKIIIKILGYFWGVTHWLKIQFNFLHFSCVNQFNIRYTLLSSHIGQGWTLFPLFKGYLQVRTNFNLPLSIHVLEYIIANNLSTVQSIGTSKGTIKTLFPTYFTYVYVLSVFPL